MSYIRGYCGGIPQRPRTRIGRAFHFGFGSEANDLLLALGVAVLPLSSESFFADKKLSIRHLFFTHLTVVGTTRSWNFGVPMVLSFDHASLRRVSDESCHGKVVL